MTIERLAIPITGLVSRPKRSDIGRCVLRLTLVALAFGLAPADVEAQVDVGVLASTEGAGVELGLPLSPSLRARLAVSSISIDEDFRAGDVDYRGEADLRWGSALLDWSPGGGAFHVSLGVALNEHEIGGTADLLPVAIDEFGAAEVQRILDLLPSDFDLGRLRATAEFDSPAPYVGIGWRSTKAQGLGLGLDLGAVLLGPADVTVRLESDLPIDQFPDGAEILEEFLREQERLIEDEVDEYELYPVVRFGLFFRF